ncbi:MAG TPA: tetratricopeptide repeat protein, partial [Nitrosopumilaceae archaeon]|nr:tetratricopeptide repeat protein [Nitrosopumilaceae archaeon]
MKFKFLFLLFSVFFIRHPLSADVDIDSLKQSISQYSDDTTGVRKIITLLQKYRETDINAAIICAEVAYQKSLDINNEKIHAEAAFFLGTVYLDMSNFVKSTQYITEALQLADKNDYKDIAIKCTNGLGNVYAMQNQRELAIELYKKSLELCKIAKNKSTPAVILGNIGNLYYQESGKDQKNLDSALTYYLKALEVHLERKDTNHIMRSYNSLGLL